MKRMFCLSASVLLAGYLMAADSPNAYDANTLQKPLKILNYNIFEGFQNGHSQTAAIAWLNSIQPDILGLEELVGWDEAKLQKTALSWRHPYAVALKGGGYNIGITSRYPVEVIERHTQGFWHGYLHCRTAGIDVILAHLWPGTRRGQLNEATQLRDLVNRLDREGRQGILMGDFNAHSPKDQAWLEKQTELLAAWQKADAKKAPEDQFFKDGKYTYSIMETVFATSLRDLVRERFDAEHPEGSYEAGTQALGSFPSRILPNSKTPELQQNRLERIDFILATPDLAGFCTDARICRNPELLEALSDHYPVLAEFKPKPAAKPQTVASTFCQSLEYAGVALQEKGWHIWGCSPMIGKDGRTHLFVERWPTCVPFDIGWRVNSEIEHYVGDKPEGPF